MQAAELWHIVDIEKRVESGDGYTWSLFKRVHAAIKSVSAREFMSANQNVNPVEATIWIWYLPGVDPTMRIKHGDVIYNIAAVLEDNQSGRHWLTLPVSRGTNIG